MNNKIDEALYEFISTADVLLNNKILAAYCLGSAAYDDFHEGYSDLDFFIVVNGCLTKEDFIRFRLLRDNYKQSQNPYLSVLEGEIVSISAIKNSNNENVIYWGTTKDQFNQKYSLSGFSLRELLEAGYLIHGTDIRKEIPYPSDEEMREQVLNMITMIRKHAAVTDENIHSADWLFLITQSIYWLKTARTTGKSLSAKWVLENCSFNWLEELKKAVKLREQPSLARKSKNKEWLRNLAPAIQIACTDLETCYKEKLK